MRNCIRICSIGVARRYATSKSCRRPARPASVLGNPKAGGHFATGSENRQDPSGAEPLGGTKARSLNSVIKVTN